ncbi:MAG: hypothetical protein CFE24_09805 [Flavobacterium sp. BFFFF2]|nr:MAG: hypothetical protein CFE24_09805 [Flavobacterium sp. BFFFF2]
MARQNLISATLENTVATDVLQKVNECKVALPFLMNLSKEQRRKSRKMGPKSVEYVSDTQVGAKLFPSSLPQDFPIDEFEKDTVLIKQLFPIFVASQALTEALNDTILALGSDCMKEADEAYSYLKLAAKTDANAKALVDQIAQRFKGQGKSKKQ